MAQAAREDSGGQPLSRRTRRVATDRIRSLGLGTAPSVRSASEGSKAGVWSRSSTTEGAGPAALPDSLSLSATSSRPSEHPCVTIHHPTVDHDSISVLDQNDQPTSPSASHPVTPLTPTLQPKGRLKYLSIDQSKPSRKRRLVCNQISLAICRFR